MLWILAAGAYAGPPATVVEHRIEVLVDAGQRLVETQTWTVRVDDPAALSAGVLAPPGLDGASDRGAVVLEDLLLVPADSPPGTVYTLSQRRTVHRGPHSGLFVTAPELPIEHAEIVVDAPVGTPLGVWADPSATPTWSSRGTRRVTMAWDDIVPGDRGNAAWSTHPDWLTAGAGTVERVEGLLADRVALGRDIGASLEGLGVAGLAEKTFELVALEPGAPGGWDTARPAREVLESRTGTAAERGVVLLSLLEVAGFEATPAWFRPASEAGAFPITIPAPILLPRPLVVVRRPDGDIFVDPAADRAAIPELPASLVGATVWVPGEMPTRLPATGVADGAVAISTTLSIAVEGAATWNVTIQATGPAQEILRNLLHPLDEAGRTEAFGRLLRQARPELTRIQASVTGADKASRKLKITVSGHDPHVFTAAGYGLRGTVAPALAPALAGWLPPHLSIVETVAIEPPPSMQILGTTVAPSLYRPEALVTRSASRQGHDVVLTVEVERPYRKTTPGRDAAAAAFLATEAPKGIELLLFTEASGTAMKALRAESSMTPDERAVLEALVWWNNDSDKKAEKIVARAEAQLGTKPVLDELERMANRADHRPWIALDEVVEQDDARRIEVVEAMEEIGARREAWERATILAESLDPDVAVRALLAVRRLQGSTRDAGADAPAWVDPIDLVLRAEERAREIDAARPDPRVVYPLAELKLQVGDVAAAEALLESVPHGERAALADALLALAAAQGGVPVAEVGDRIDRAVAADPFDPQVVGIAAEAAARVGDVRQAQRLGLTAARLAHDDPERWTIAVPLSLVAGDLATAADAAHEASDLDPENTARASTWELLATLMLDRAAVDEARLRAGLTPVDKWPLTIDERIGLAPEAALLALLQYAEADVIADARLLAMRTQLRIDAGLLDDAARDGVLLATRHGDPEGHALAFAATAGRQYSTSAIAALDRAARTDATAQTTRMEYRLVAGTGDPLEDARRLGDDPRGAALTALVARPSTAAAVLEGWPSTLPRASRAGAPSGYRSNRVLSAFPGVVGYSHPEAARAVVRVSAVTGLVPPPIGALYTPSTQVLERLPGGGQVIRLEGGVIPLYAAVEIDGAEEVYGFAFTVEGAKRALADALGN
jgi:hypothetical protein